MGQIWLKLIQDLHNYSAGFFGQKSGRRFYLSAIFCYLKGSIFFHSVV
jgi:hypothetical protein